MLPWYLEPTFQVGASEMHQEFLERTFTTASALWLPWVEFRL